MRTLQDYALVQPGHPFRGSIPEVADGSVLTIQMRDVDIATGVAWQGVARTNPGGRKEPNWLQVGDIIFLARGAHNFAAYVSHVPGPAVCSQSFFLLRVTDSNLLPAFLAWQINQIPAQNYLRKNAEGTNQVSIRRGILEGLPITVPPLAQQQQLLCFAEVMQRERQYMEQMIHNRERQMHSIALQILSTPTPNRKTA